MLNFKKLMKTYIQEHKNQIEDIMSGKYLSFEKAMRRLQDYTIAYQGIKKLYIQTKLRGEM